MRDADPVVVERRGAVAIVRLNRPDRMNAVSSEVLIALGRFGRELGADADVRAIVVTGAGDRAFCAGADLKERRGMGDEEVRARVALWRTELDPIDRCPKPVVAAIGGVCLGGGLELALACDLRVAAPGARLGLPETSLGIIPGAGGTQRLPRVVGEARAKEMILFALRLDAREALAWGLVNRVSPDGVSVVDDAIAWIDPLVSGAPIALGAALAAIDASFDVPLARGLEIERDRYDECLRSEDRLEALRAFAEKRRPVFRGR